MKQLYFFVFLFCLSVSVMAQHYEPCAAEIYFQEAVKNDPSLLLKREALEEQTQQYIAARKRQRVSAEPLRIIPVVFHIIHEGGPENISKAQILDQMRILNEDYRRKNPDTASTPQPFKSLGADCNIEFRLAKKDPLGRCTDGIVRVFSHRTNNAQDTAYANEIKNLSVWDNSRYLNIWVVKSFAPRTGGTLLGYAQFPDGGKNGLDGVILLSSFVGSIGTATNSTSRGRVATHEIGHWLNLRHIWGDASCGSDLVEDTPPQQEESSACPTFPQVSCGGPNGDMFSNYMDYSHGKCQNIFTKGQKLRMDATLAGFRAKLVSNDNLVFTGTNDGAITNNCAPTPAFTSNYQTICEGAAVTFKDGSFNADSILTDWSFEGGDPATSTDASPFVRYNVPGVYKVTLNAATSGGSNTLIKEKMVHVSPLTPLIKDPYFEGFEEAAYPTTNWIVVNSDNGPTWTKTTAVSYSGAGSIKISNFSGNAVNEVDELISPTMDLSNISAPKLTFRLAYGQKDPAYQDRLKIFVSTDCGKTWTERYNKSANGLSAQSGGLQYTAYAPKSKSEWKLETVDMKLTSVTSTNARFKFQFTSAMGNNIYIDDISISQPLGVNDADVNALQLKVYPNPADENARVDFLLLKEEKVEVKIVDVLGRELTTIVDQKLAPGQHSYSIGKVHYSGICFLKLKLEKSIYTTRFILNK